ncbi:sulfatase-like hydrolase/transferase [Flammeovirga yaeyamensis]|uniref:Sulfatase-like hydrolase/transferase n=1 Tax=Flammeovirga yaeyamensis TaxID=367791 RepID=A0AAX1NE27_9BACT|nr:sulfatase-like hydrolase/transferase [Flammeovirga yaeyamensis]MBB3699917.1 arylsulfatase A-like enzyme [Flammeovirga yaeyamensis]NMF37644.1 sulfatase-like hydrolase/transferase [Flammeovirga yaeyamensis]QWG04700.1 sulfatase-like hydrolase/transferase [Flammeovirga yaeyamensis]
MKKLTNSLMAILVLFFLGNIAHADDKDKSPRPNIIMIVLDDLGYADMGFMPNSAKDIYTPNLDKLASEGTVFTSAYVTHPYCGPSRAGILTGRMPHVFGAQFNLAAFSGFGVAKGETFMSDVMQQAGYHTGIVGKWHLGEEGEFHPNERGFDYFYGFLGGGHEYYSNSWLPAATYDPSQYKIGQYAKDYHRPMMKNDTFLETEKGLFLTDVLTDATLDFLDESAKDDEPFFLYLSYNAPHTPLQAKESDIEDMQKHLGKNAAEKGSKRLTYTAMVYNVDYNVKRIVDRLEANGELENTMIVFISDNGGKTTAGADNTPLQGKKGDAYEGGFRVPMFVYYPNSKLEKGGTYTHNISTLDFFPTFAGLAGASIPKSKILDGKDVWTNIIEKTDPRKDESIYVMRHFNANNRTGVVRNNYKLYTDGTGEWQLFDLTKDIGETKDISAKNKKLVSIMKNDVNEWSYTWEEKRPEFFDAPHYNFEMKWDKFNMPNLERTFGDIHKKSK